jgi:hypothetical protein
VVASSGDNIERYRDGAGERYTWTACVRCRLAESRTARENGANIIESKLELVVGTLRALNI